MKTYFVKTPKWLHKIYPSFTWSFPHEEKSLYLTFDDGPSKKFTQQILDVLKKENVLATFFCVGKKVENHPDVFDKIIAEGHSYGNHTFQHLNSWKTDNKEYFKDVKRGENIIQSNLFRPPYGKIKRAMIDKISSKYHVVMWSLMPGDFDEKVSKEACLNNITNKVKEGDIIVLHDNEKSQEKVLYVLPKLINWAKKNGFKFKAIPI